MTVLIDGRPHQGIARSSAIRRRRQAKSMVLQALFGRLGRLNDEREHSGFDTQRFVYRHAAARAVGKIASGKFFSATIVTLSLFDRRDGATYAALNHGHFGVKLHRKDKNDKWEEIATPALSAEAEGLVDLDGWGKPVNWTTQMIWALEPGGDDQPGVLWAGTMPGGLFRSLDRGASWELIPPPCGRCLNATNGWVVGPIFPAFIRSVSIPVHRKR